MKQILPQELAQVVMEFRPEQKQEYSDQFGNKTNQLPMVLEIITIVSALISTNCHLFISLRTSRNGEGMLMKIEKDLVGSTVSLTINNGFKKQILNASSEDFKRRKEQQSTRIH